MNNDKNNYKLKRPSKGYQTEEERNFAQWSGVSDWEVFFKNKKIGIIYKTTSYSGDWGWSLDYAELEFGKHDYAQTRRDAFDDIVHEHQKIRRYS